MSREIVLLGVLVLQCYTHTHTTTTGLCVAQYFFQVCVGCSWYHAIPVLSSLSLQDRPLLWCSIGGVAEGFCGLEWMFGTLPLPFHCVVNYGSWLSGECPRVHLPLKPCQEQTSLLWRLSTTGSSLCSMAFYERSHWQHETLIPRLILTHHTHTHMIFLHMLPCVCPVLSQDSHMGFLACPPHLIPVPPPATPKAEGVTRNHASHQAQAWPTLPG